MGFAEAIALERRDEAVWGFGVGPEWAQGRAAFGGLVAGAVVRAASAVLPGDRPIRSVLIDFAAPVLAGDAEVAARVVRSGRSLTHVEARVRQGGEDAVVALIAAGARRPTAVALPAPAPPAGPDPDACPSLPYVPGVTPTFTQHFEYRWASPHPPFGGSGVPRVAGFIRHRGGAPADVASLLAFTDGWPPPVVAMGARPFPASTVTWMVEVFAEPPPGGWPGDGWFRYASETTVSGEGYTDVRASVWAPDGRLVANSSQLVAEFSA